MKLSDFQPNDPVWIAYDDDEYPGTVVKINEEEHTLTMVSRHHNADGPYLITNIVGLHAISQGRLYHRKDGEVISWEQPVEGEVTITDERVS